MQLHGALRAVALTMAVVFSAGAGDVCAQSLQVGIIDFYGLHRVTEAQARAALTVKEGDIVSIVDEMPPAFVVESERRLSALAGVRRAYLNVTCCDAGRGIVFVGLEEQTAPAVRFRQAPRGRVRLAPEVVQAGRELSQAWMAAVQRGDTAEDRSQGHSLLHDPGARAIQQRFIGYAGRDIRWLRDVLRHSSDDEHRALAAEILAYAPDKRDVIGDLVQGMNDASASVRNNAARALVVIAGAKATVLRGRLQIPAGPFIRLLNSPVWTDRNKASLALMELSADRDPELLAALRTRAIVPLVEMARWKSEGHAMPAFRILGRIAGRSDEDIDTAWVRGDRDAIVNLALGLR